MKKYIYNFQSRYFIISLYLLDTSIYNCGNFAHAPRVFSMHYYTCVSTPFRKCIFYSRHINRNSMTTQQYLLAKTTKTNKRKFYLFYFSPFFMICNVRIDFSLVFFLYFLFFGFYFFFHFTSSIQTHTRNRQNAACVIIIIMIIRVTVHHE